MGTKRSRRSLMSEAKRDALHDKFDHPEKGVKCPTCGVDLEFVDSLSATYVRCPECGIADGIKGL